MHRQHVIPQTQNSQSEEETMTKRFTDKVVLVTGASGGLGKITAERFAADGSLTGYGGGMENKQALLKLEGVKI